jgi:CDP-diacylglycerol--serine O-phosphatidyltransferase
MPRLRTEAAKKSLLRRVRRQRLKYITILPSLVTILNGVCGFTAIILASKGIELAAGRFAESSRSNLFAFGGTSYFAMSGYMILLAMIADMLDGRLARISQNTSSFGGQLDSLCDIVSFGVAPAFLMLKMLEYKLTDFTGLNPTLETFLHRFIWLAAAAYVSCAAIRLARFNVENEEDESAHMSFIGLPTPAAAGVIVSLIILHQETLPTLNIIIYALPFLAVGVAILMVSRIRYPHILNQYLKGKKPFAHLIRVLLLLAFVIWNIQAAMVLIFCGFAAGSFLRWLYFKIVRDKSNLVSRQQRLAFMGIDDTNIAGQDNSDGSDED